MGVGVTPRQAPPATALKLDTEHAAAVAATDFVSPPVSGMAALFLPTARRNDVRTNQTILKAVHKFEERLLAHAAALAPIVAAADAAVAAVTAQALSPMSRAGGAAMKVATPKPTGAKTPTHAPAAEPSVASASSPSSQRPALPRPVASAVVPAVAPETLLTPIISPRRSSVAADFHQAALSEGDDIGQVRQAEAAERVLQHRRDEALRRKQEAAAARAKAEYIKQTLAEKERQRLQLEEEIMRVKMEMLSDKQARDTVDHQHQGDHEAWAKEQQRKAAERVPVTPDSCSFLSLSSIH